jgi:hypothetical protein
MAEGLLLQPDHVRRLNEMLRWFEPRRGALGRETHAGRHGQILASDGYLLGVLDDWLGLGGSGSAAFASRTCCGACSFMKGTTSGVPPTSSTTVSVYGGTAGSETDTGVDITGWGWLINRGSPPIPPGTKVLCVSIHGYWYVVPPDWFGAFHSSSSSQSSPSSPSSPSSSSSSSPSSSPSSGSESQSSGSGGSGSGEGSGKSTAIVPVPWNRTGYAALFVTEAPDVRFEDLLIATLKSTTTRVPIDLRFLSVCDAGTIEVCGCVPARPVAVGASIEGDQIRLQTARRPQQPLRVVVHLSGIRRGFRQLRFPSRTKAQFVANEAFIKSAYKKPPRRKSDGRHR